MTHSDAIDRLIFEEAPDPRWRLSGETIPE